MYEIVREGKAAINIPKVSKLSKQMEVFYNPVMKFNRDISVLVLSAIDKNKLNIADPLAGSGIRAIRFLLELKKSKIKTISINDYSTNAVKSIKKNLSLNKLSKSIKKKIIISNEDANLFLLNSQGFDYVDIDPFGTPNPYLDNAVKRLSREGLLAVTATDTSALCGTYPKACLRKYWAVPLRNELMHEIGLRILIRKVQLIGAQYNKALIPIFSYSKDHYMRVFLRCEKAKDETDKVLKQHGHYEDSGPMWKGQLWDKGLVDKMFKSIKNNKKIIYDDQLIKFLDLIKNESKIDTIGFFDIHKVVKRNKLKNIPKKLELVEKIRKAGYNVSETHFNPEAVKSNIELKRLIKILR
ncbi:MAG: tRNA (guanine(26)-N(2))-dimethyltransferase [Nanoarchaeota archaeon]|nr:tRNA (guanine(26)-N(2))-dimethyltransferase [Nanoarchaeota archaeon]